MHQHGFHGLSGNRPKNTKMQPELKHALWEAGYIMREGTMTADAFLKAGYAYVNGTGSEIKGDLCRHTTIKVEREGVLRYFLKVRAKTKPSEVSHVQVISDASSVGVDGDLNAYYWFTQPLDAGNNFIQRTFLDRAAAFEGPFVGVPQVSIASDSNVSWAWQ